MLTLAVAVAGVAAAGPRLRPPYSSRSRNQPGSTVVTVGDSVVATVAPGFVGMGWEMDAMLGMMNDIQDPTFAKAASHLSPAIVRVGGITADWVRYDGFSNVAAAAHKTTGPASRRQKGSLGGYWPTHERSLTLSNFTTLLNFMSAANLSLMFDLNELHGRNCTSPNPSCGKSTSSYCHAWCEGAWDLSNVLDLLQYVHDHSLVGGSSPLYAFEVGNELISHEDAQNTTADMITLAGHIQKIWGDRPADQRPLLYGPSTDACSDQGQLDIITNISKVPGIGGFTFHGYPGHNGTGVYALDTLLRNVTWLRTGILTGSDAQGCIDKWNGGPRQTGLQLMLTEASSSYNFQLPPPAQDSTLHTLFTVAQLGQYSKTGIGMVGRWSLSEESPFATIRYTGTDPTTQKRTYRVAADYWVMLAHKATAGPRVLEAELPVDAPALAYAYCGWHPNGSVAIGTANPSNSPVTLSLPGVGLTPRFEYVFTAPEGNVSNVAPSLNGGEPLVIQPDGSLPPSFEPKFVGSTGASDSGAETIVLPPLSSAYFLLLDAGIAACATKKETRTHVRGAYRRVTRFPPTAG